MMTARVITTILHLLYYTFCPSFVYSSDDPCGHHALQEHELYYTFCPSFVYSSDDPCGHHALQEHEPYPYIYPSSSLKR